jgi:hypothetical protein
MVFKTQDTDCSVLGYSDAIQITVPGRMAIQPIGTGTGTVTVQASNDGDNWFDLDPTTTAISIDEPILISECDWQYYRMAVPGGFSGSKVWAISVK